MIKPSVAWLTVNRKCNFRCQWCYAEGTKYGPEDDMSIEKALELVRMLTELGVKDVVIIGGEPTLWPHLSKLNSYCRENGIETSIVTNAARFGDDKYWNNYLKNPCDYAGISIKGGTPEQLLSVAKVKNFELVEKGISRAVEYYNTGVSSVYNSLVEDSFISNR